MPPTSITQSRRIRGLDEIRRRFFIAGDTAQRYDVAFAEVVEHLWRARRRRPRLRLRAVVFVDDLIHSVALRREHARAWEDLDARYTMPLVHRCVPLLDDAAASLHVRQIMHRLRQPTKANDPNNAWYSYVGTQPLGLWLTERVIGAMPRVDTWRFGPLHETPIPLRLEPASMSFVLPGVEKA
ncbi:MAG: hypothetical protein AAF432_11865 [Planctomycetota bacterium]